MSGPAGFKAAALAYAAELPALISAVLFICGMFALAAGVTP